MGRIPQRLLNLRVSIIEVNQVLSDSGDGSNEETVIASDVPMRINRNATSKNEYTGAETGKFATSTHVAFSNPDITVTIGNYILNGSKKYRVDEIDFEPGGDTDHHYEIGVTLIQ